MSTWQLSAYKLPSSTARCYRGWESAGPDSRRRRGKGDLLPPTSWPAICGRGACSALVRQRGRPRTSRRADTGGQRPSRSDNEFEKPFRATRTPTLSNSICFRSRKPSNCWPARCRPMTTTIESTPTPMRVSCLPNYVIGSLWPSDSGGAVGGRTGTSWAGLRDRAARGRTSPRQPPL